MRSAAASKRRTRPYWRTPRNSRLITPRCWPIGRRTNFATLPGLRSAAQYGLEAAQVIFGHAKADVTQVYAERDMALAAEVMEKIG